MNQPMINPVSPRRVSTAVALSLFFPGIGQVYGGKIVKGLFLGFLNEIPLPTVLIALALNPSYTRTFPIVLALLVQAVLLIYTIIDAGLLAHKAPPDYRLKEYNRWYVYLLLILMGTGSCTTYALQFRDDFFEAFRVSTSSMYPTFNTGDRFLANKFIYNSSNPERGDVIVFSNPDNKNIVIIKRIVAIAGDTVEIKDGRLILNGRPLPCQKVSSASLTERGSHFSGDIFYETNGQAKYKTCLVTRLENSSIPPMDLAKTTVPKNHCFVLGDNRNQSWDSRNFGPIPLAAIKGRVDYLYFMYKDWFRFGKIINR